MFPSTPLDLEHFFELSADLLYITDSNGCFLRVNLTFEQQLGYNRQELLSRTVLELVDPEDRLFYQQRLAELSINQPIAHFRGRILSQDGRRLCLDWSITVAHRGDYGLLHYCIARNITQHKQLEDEIQSLNQHLDSYILQSNTQLEQALQTSHLYANTIQNMPLGLYIWRLEQPDDPHSFRLIATNPIASQLSGIPTADILNRPITETFPHLLHNGILDIYLEVLRTGQSRDLGEVVAQHPQSNTRILSIKVFPLPDRCVGVTFENVTQRKQAELDLKAQRDELTTMNLVLARTMRDLERRNEELIQFAYVASHDLKAPLRAIGNLASWLQEDLDGKLPEDNQYQLQLMQGRVHRMEGLIDGLLEYSRVGRFNQAPEVVDVGRLLQEVIRTLKPPETFVVKIVGDMPTLVTKRLPLLQVFTNLISNAIKHHDHTVGQVQISARPIPSGYEFAVADDGPGIDPSYHDKIFSIFQTLKARDTFESTGIGLAIVKKILTAEGGEIIVDSQEGQGATFKFTWPGPPKP